MQGVKQGSALVGSAVIGVLGFLGIVVYGYVGAACLWTKDQVAKAFR
jgi:hypothetical protein